MKENKFFLPAALACVLTVACGAAVLVRTFMPAVLIPALDIPNMVALSLVALLADHYIAGSTERCYLSIAAFAAVCFGLLPLCAGFAGGMQALWLAVKGCAAFTATAWLYSAMMDRLSTGPNAKLAPVLSAVGLYLAAQCFTGLF